MLPQDERFRVIRRHRSTLLECIACAYLVTYWSDVEDITKLRSMVKKWARLWRVPSLARVEIATNARLRTCLGRCFPKANRIQLNPTLLQKKSVLLHEVLCHEAAHIAAYTLEPGQSRAHGRQWALMMMVAGFKPQTTIPARQCIQGRGLDEVRTELFEHRCPVCGFTRLARRPMSRWRCRTCVAAGFSGDFDIRTRRVRAKAEA
jgi:predicted SprT family Zn-dependent metalloprotease